MGIAVQLIMPTLYLMIFEEEMIWESWYWVALYSPIVILFLMLCWVYQSIVKLEPRKTKDYECK